jgi:hypothetical protein
MEFLKDRRVLIALGATLALVAGVGIAMVMTRGSKPTEPPPASQGGLVVETGSPDDGRLDPARPLRCFVAGQYVGALTLAECAKRNGVATGALDVGLDESGELAAADQAGTVLTPLPPQQVTPIAPVQAAPAAPEARAPSGPTGDCLAYAAGRWREIASQAPLPACVQALFSGRCEKPGGATYGRWGEQTLRLVPGRVEISSDNRSFRTLGEPPTACPG